MSRSWSSPRSRGRVAALIRHYLLVTTISVFVLFPFFWMVSISLKPANELMLSPPRWLPSQLNFDSYLEVWDVLPLLTYLTNSAIVALATTLVSLILAAGAGYSLSRFKTRIRTFSQVLFIFSQLIPSVVPFVSYYFIMRELHLLNTYAGLIITYGVWAIPFGIMMMKNYFSAAVPAELEESAAIDGLSRVGVFIRIVLPISVPGLAATGIFSFILAWNEFMWASVILTKNSLKPVSVGIYDFVGPAGSSAGLGMMMTAAVLVTIPAILMFAVLQRYLISGLTAGAVKG